MRQKCKFNIRDIISFLNVMEDGKERLAIEGASESSANDVYS